MKLTSLQVRLLGMFAVLVLLSALVLSTYDQNDINYT
jgi:hypothetical protein